MDSLNAFQKTRIILVVLIIISLSVLIISVIKSKDKKKYIAEETLSNIETKVNEIENQSIDSLKQVEEIQGDVIETDDTSWDDPNAKETKVDEKEAQKSKMTYYVKINYAQNVVTIYKQDGEGKYTIPVKVMVCSTGAATPTSGVYKMSNKYRWHQLNGGVYGQYCSRITGHILFHSVPYATNSPDSLKYVAYDKLGTKASAGCIRLTVADAMWVYSNCSSGTCVEFYSDSNPGPLGKPSTQKISSNETCRNWDPTDPTSGNPWHNYKEPEPVPVEENKTKTENSKKQDNNSRKEEIQDTNQAIPENTSNNEDNPQNNEKNLQENTTPQNTENSDNTVDTEPKEEQKLENSNEEKEKQKEETDTEQKEEEKKENTESNKEEP